MPCCLGSASCCHGTDLSLSLSLSLPLQTVSLLEQLSAKHGWQVDLTESMRATPRTPRHKKLLEGERHVAAMAMAADDGERDLPLRCDPVRSGVMAANVEYCTNARRVVLDRAIGPLLDSASVKLNDLGLFSRVGRGSNRPPEISQLDRVGGTDVLVDALCESLQLLEIGTPAPVLYDRRTRLVAGLVEVLADPCGVPIEELDNRLPQQYTVQDVGALVHLARRSADERTPAEVFLGSRSLAPRRRTWSGSERCCCKRQPMRRRCTRCWMSWARRDIRSTCSRSGRRCCWRTCRPPCTTAALAVDSRC